MTDAETDDERSGGYADAIEQQAELEQLVREKGSFEAAVEAQRRGEKPHDDPKNVSGT